MFWSFNPGGRRLLTTKYIIPQKGRTLWRIAFSQHRFIFNILLFHSSLLLFFFSPKIRRCPLICYARAPTSRGWGDPPFRTFRTGPVLRCTHTHRFYTHTPSDDPWRHSWSRTHTWSSGRHSRRRRTLFLHSKGLFTSVSFSPSPCVYPRWKSSVVCSLWSEISSAFWAVGKQVGPVTMPYERWVIFDFKRLMFCYY